MDASYRNRVVVTCCAVGRQTAEFANGKGNYGAYVELTRPDGSWISQGMGIVPVLPDGNILMVVEQRPPQFRLPNQPTHIVVDGKTIDLQTFGPYSSVEFPGGAVDPNDKKLRAGFLKELKEETEVPDQEVIVYMRKPPLFAQGADLALEGRICVVFLENMRYEKHVKTDGGLDVLSLSPKDVSLNIMRGNIRSGQAALMQWYFYSEVMDGLMNSTYLTNMMKLGYIEFLRAKLG